MEISSEIDKINKQRNHQVTGLTVSNFFIEAEKYPLYLVQLLIHSSFSLAGPEEATWFRISHV